MTEREYTEALFAATYDVTDEVAFDAPDPVWFACLRWSNNLLLKRELES